MTLWSLLITPTDSESPGKWHLTQATDLQSQQEWRGTVRVPGDTSQLRGDSGVQSPGLAEGQHYSQASKTTAASQEELPTTSDRQEAEKVQLTGAGQHELRPEGGLHLHLSHILQHS